MCFFRVALSIILLLGFTLLMASEPEGKVFQVPDEFPTIQEAIDICRDGDVVLVNKGIYRECIDFTGKAITVASHFWLDGNDEHIANTIISGNTISEKPDRSLVSFVNGEDNRSVLMGFTLTEGKGTILYDGKVKCGGAILCLNSHPMILHNRIVYNEVKHPYLVFGAGICIIQTKQTTLKDSLIIRHNRIRFNSVVASKTSFGGGIFISGPQIVALQNNCIRSNSTRVGGGMAVFSGYPYLHNNRFTTNQALYGAGLFMVTRSIQSPTGINNVDGQLVAQNDPAREEVESALEILPVFNEIPPVRPQIFNCTFTRNLANASGGAIYSLYTNADIKNSILWKDMAFQEGTEIHARGAIDVTYSNIYKGWVDIPGNNNIEADPLFVDLNGCCLIEDSPCIDAGHPDALFNDPENPEKPGQALSPAWGTIRNDMGAFGGPCACDWCPYFIPAEKVLSTTPEDITPTTARFHSNFPNPFNPTTTISFDLAQSGFVSLRIFNVLGEEVATLVAKQLNAGNYSYTWDASNLAGGIYVYRLETNNFAETKKMILVK